METLKGDKDIVASLEGRMFVGCEERRRPELAGTRVSSWWWRLGGPCRGRVLRGLAKGEADFVMDCNYRVVSPCSGYGTRIELALLLVG